MTRVAQVRYNMGKLDVQYGMHMSVQFSRLLSDAVGGVRVT